MPHVELMKERYEVIADYPNSHLKVGEILTVLTDEESKHLMYKDEWFKKYPAIFKRLSWHERRDVSEMPEYVKHGSEVRKVIVFKLNKTITEVSVTLEKPFGNYDREWFILEYCEPATKSDYENYTKNKE